MTEIDQLQRITLRDLKPFYSHLAKMGADHPRRGRGLLEGTMTLNSEWNHPTITILASVNEENDIESFLFKWVYDGRKREQRVYITSLPSNLIEGVNCPYFICPHTHKYCRKLYTDGSVLTSRYSFPHTYSKRNQSHSTRKLFSALDAMEDVDKPHRYRKEIYRGKITPYGYRMRKNYKRLLRYLGTSPRSVELYNEACADLQERALLSRRGRPTSKP